MFIPPKKKANIARKIDDDFLEPAEVVFRIERTQEVEKLIVEYLTINKYQIDDEKRDLFSHYIYILSKPETPYEEYEETYKKAKQLING